MVYLTIILCTRLLSEEEIDRLPYSRKQLILKNVIEGYVNMNQMYIIGLGAGDLDQLPLGVYKQLKIPNIYF